MSTPAGATGDGTPVAMTAHGPATGPASRADVVGTALLAVLGLAAALWGRRYGFTVEGQVGAGFLPVVTGGFIALASAAELVRLGVQRRALRADGHGPAGLQHEQAAAVPADPAEAETDVFGRTSAQRGRAIGVVFGLLLVAVLLVPLLGLLISLSLAVLVLLLVVERKPPVPSLVGALACLAFGYFVFVQALGAPLPTGLLGLV